MASEFTQEYAIPGPFAEILREFSREAIRNSPKDINAFAYQYFLGLHNGDAGGSFAAQTRHGADGAPPLRVSISGVKDVDDVDPAYETGRGHGDGSPNEGSASGDNRGPTLSTEMLQDRISLLFSEADADGNGHLSRREFAEIFTLLASELGLNEKDVLLIMAEADENDDGVIEYAEFVPVAADLVITLLAKERYAEARQIREGARAEAKDLLLKGMPREELEGAIRDVFRSVDTDGNNTLDRAEFASCLRHSGLGFTRRELNLILTMVDKNGDGVIDYEEFVPICFGMLLEVVSQRLTEVPAEETAIQEYIHSKLEEKAGPGDRVEPADGLKCLKNADLGLTLVQLHAIMTECSEAADGTISRHQLASACAGVIMALQEVQGTDRVQKYRSIVHSSAAGESGGGEPQVAGITRTAFRARTERALSALDPESTGGVPSREDVRSALAEAFPELDDRQVAALLSLAEPVAAAAAAAAVAEAGGHGQGAPQSWSYKPLLEWGFKTLQNLPRHRFLLSEHRAKSAADM